MEQKIWHIETDGQQQGPFSIDDLLQKDLNGDSIVWKNGMEKWLPAKEVPEMADAFNLTKTRNDIEIDVYKFMADENAEIRLQIKRLEKSYEEFLDEKPVVLKAMADEDAELCSQVSSLKKDNEELLNLKLSLTMQLKALENENVELRSRLKQLFNRLIRGIEY